MSGPEPMSFELFLGSVVWFFKTYFMLMLGIMGVIVVIVAIVGIFMYLAYRRRRKSILSGEGFPSLGRFPK